jgi:hypothetical protein
MPKATVSQDVVRKDLKSCPDGWVELRQLPFGQMLTRRDKASRLVQEARPNAKQNDMVRVQFEILHEWSNQYDFKHCIVDHNLEDDEGQKLDFGNPMTLQVLDPKIGAEIEGYITEMNQEEFDEALFTQQLGASTKNGTSNNSESLE